jgi:transposase InsO family protein
MKKAHICSARRKAYKRTTNSNHSNPIAPNLLERNFSFSHPNQAWVSDITYIPTGEGWLYLAIVKDLCTKKIVGYAMSPRIDTQLTLDALYMAVRRQKPKPGLIFHSDRGVQYASHAFRQALEKLAFRQSMSRKGDPYDNAVAENFFSCLKCECIYLSSFISRNAANIAVFRYIETFYNVLRPHSSIGWLTPSAFEHQLSNHFLGSTA